VGEREKLGGKGITGGNEKGKKGKNKKFQKDKSGMIMETEKGGGIQWKRGGTTTRPIIQIEGKKESGRGKAGWGTKKTEFTSDKCRCPQV